MVHLKAGSAVTNITPSRPMHLSGYPFVERMSTGVHDALQSAALYLTDGNTEILFIANDLLFISKNITQNVRKGICKKYNIGVNNIVITATHTHSAPDTIELAILEHDATLPALDEAYVSFIESQMIEAGCRAIENAAQAYLEFAVADATGIGTNRHNPEDICDLSIPVLLAKNKLTNEPIACMLVCNMHPTVLHEDSTLISGDFPGIAKHILQKEVIKYNCPIIYHTGTAGNQSPRYVTKENTFAEATRIANILADAVSDALKKSTEINDPEISVLAKEISLPRKNFPDVETATLYEKACSDKLQVSKNDGSSKQQIRTNEVNWFGAVEMLHLSKMNEEGRLEDYYKSCLPAEIKVITIGNVRFITWPGEIFVEYGLAIKSEFENTFIITLANGDLQIYVCTEGAAKAGVYESCNSIFDYKSGEMLVSETIQLIKNNSCTSSE